MLYRLREAALKLLRLHGTPHGIALGFTLGLALSLIPIPFLGMGLALLLAPWLGASLPAAYIGSAVVNPVTGPAIYFAELWVGGTLLEVDLPSWSEARGYDSRRWWTLFRELLPAFGLGALVCIAVSSALAYPALRAAVRWFRRRGGDAAPEDEAQDSPGEDDDEDKDEDKDEDETRESRQARTSESSSVGE